MYRTWTWSPGFRSAAVMAFPDFLMAVFESTANVHSASFISFVPWTFSFPATTRLSADADFTTPWAFLVFFISADFCFESAGFFAGGAALAAPGAGLAAGVEGGGVGCAG